VKKKDEREAQKSQRKMLRVGIKTDLISESSEIVTPISYNSMIIKVAQGRIKRYDCPTVLLRDPFLDEK